MKKNENAININKIVEDAINAYAEYLTIDEIRALIVGELVLKGYDPDQAQEIVDIFDYEMR